MGEYDANAEVPGARPQAEAGVRGLRRTGAWESPEGWRPRWMWTGAILEGPAPEYRIVTQGERAKRVPIAASERRPRRVPELILVDTYHEYRNRLSGAQGMERKWQDAKDLPMDLREMIVDAYGEARLNDVQRAICAPVLQARAAEKERAAAATAARRGLRGGPVAETKRTTKATRAKR